MVISEFTPLSVPSFLKRLTTFTEHLAFSMHIAFQDRDICHNVVVFMIKILEGFQNVVVGRRHFPAGFIDFTPKELQTARFFLNQTMLKLRLRK